MPPSHWLASPAVSLLAGVAQALSIADPWTGQPHWWLQIASLAVLAWQLVRRAERQALPAARAWRGGFWRGWLFGLGWLTGTFWWLFISMHTYGGLPAPLAGAAVLALAGALALYYALAAAAFMALTPEPLLARRPALCALGFAALWTLAELARGTLLTGFPWGAGGYAHVDGPLAGYAPWVGVYGIGFLAAWLAGVGGSALSVERSASASQSSPPDAQRPTSDAQRSPLNAQRSPLNAHRPPPDAQRSTPGAQRATRAILAALLLCLPWAMNRIAPPNNPADTLPPMTVALLQGNIPQDEKFVAGTGVDDSLRWYGEQLQSVTAPLVVAPETALPVLPSQLPEGYWVALAGRFAHSDQAALLGIPLGDPAQGYTNSVIGFAPSPGAARRPLPQAGEGREEDAPYRYDKRHLVPFGEFIPPLFKWFVRLMNIPLGDFERGGVEQPSFAWGSQRLAPNICYEDLFGEELGARFADPARAPTVFVNVSNIAWFGDSVAIDQHLQISRMRALEFERPMLRATNTGATAIIDYRGQVTHLLPRLTRAVLTGQFEGRTRLTPYARWVARAGLWPLAAACALLAAALALCAAAGRNRR